MVHTGVYRQYDAEGHFDVDFIDNGRFAPVNRNAKVALKRGTFTVSPLNKRHIRHIRTYRSVFATYVRHSGFVHSRTPHSFGNALFRTFHDKNSQSKRMQFQPTQLAHSGLSEWFDRIRLQVDSLAPTDHWVDVILREAYKTHPKRGMRVGAYEEMVERGSYGQHQSDFIACLSKKKGVLASLKPLEFGKPNKNGRITFDLGVPASLRAGYLMETIKMAWAKESFNYCGVKFVFVKSPDIDVLSHWFNRMRTESICLFFSDDACVSLRTKGGMMWFNLDISGCDASNGSFVFEALRKLVPERLMHEYQMLVEQCTAELQVGYRKEKMTFRPNGPYEYSGSVLTTCLNNVAVCAILFHIVPANPESRERSDLSDHILERIGTLGWSVTIEDCEVLEDLQFLKCSPCYTVEGDVRAVLNLGVILRSMGQKSYDLPGRGPLDMRVRCFMGGWVAGLVHAGEHQLMHTLRELWPMVLRKKKYFNSNAVERLSSRGPHPPLDENSLVRRYRSTLFDLDQLCYLLRVCGTECVGVRTRFTDSVMDKDYGMPCTDGGRVAPYMF